MRLNRMGIGLMLSALLFFPFGILDLLVAFNYSIGNWAATFPILPYLAYGGVAAILRWRGYPRLGKGMIVGGVVFSTLIISGVLFLAWMFSALTEFG